MAFGIAIATSFTQFVPRNVQLKDHGQLVARELEAPSGVAKSVLTSYGPVRICESQDGAMEKILGGKIVVGDIIEIEIPNRSIHLAVDEATLAARRADKEAPGGATFCICGAQKPARAPPSATLPAAMPAEAMPSSLMTNQARWVRCSAVNG